MLTCPSNCIYCIYLCSAGHPSFQIALQKLVIFTSIYSSWIRRWFQSCSREEFTLLKHCTASLFKWNKHWMNPYASHTLPSSTSVCVMSGLNINKTAWTRWQDTTVTHPPDRRSFYFLVASMKMNKQVFKLPRKEKPLYPYSFCLFIQVLLLLLC